MQERLIVDGYNMIGAWPQLNYLKQQGDIEGARDLLLEELSDYVAYEGIETWVVFDAQFVPGLSKSYDKYNCHVVFTAEGETADSYIEAMIKDTIGVLRTVTVATSDLAEQRLIFQQGAIRKSARELLHDVEFTHKTIREGDDSYHQSGYKRHVPWSYLQLEQLKGLLDHLSKDD
ncbi:MAG: NYN domain-containing protein [Aerococcus sp.]|nr:NYN domain-containing protein [Aerococcus sp.]